MFTSKLPKAFHTCQRLLKPPKPSKASKALQSLTEAAKASQNLPKHPKTSQSLRSLPKRRAAWPALHGASRGDAWQPCCTAPCTARPLCAPRSRACDARSLTTLQVEADEKNRKKKRALRSFKERVVGFRRRAHVGKVDGAQHTVLLAKLSKILRRSRNPTAGSTSLPTTCPVA